MFNKLREIKGKGVTIVIVSHSMGQLEQICDRSIWLEKGKIVMDGIPSPEEYVLTGLSIYSSNSENSIISSNLLSISFLVNPKIAALKSSFS